MNNNCKLYLKDLGFSISWMFKDTKRNKLQICNYFSNSYKRNKSNIEPFYTYDPFEGEEKFKEIKEFFSKYEFKHDNDIDRNKTGSMIEILNPYIIVEDEETAFYIKLKYGK